MSIMLSLAAAVTIQAQAVSPVVSPEWLAAHLEDPSVVVLHIARAVDFDSAHIPGAQRIEWSSFGPDQEGGLSLNLPDARAFVGQLEGFGISNTSHVVIVYHGLGITGATRLFLTMDWIGHGARTSILDAGMTGWRRAGKPVTTAATVARPRGRFEPHPRADLIVQHGDLRRLVSGSSWNIVDARATVFYTGERQGIGTRRGHIPGAVSLPYNTTVNDDLVFPTPDGARRLLTDAGVDPSRPLVAYCHIGQQASLVWFTARLAGLDAHLYDGSFQEWSRLQTYPTLMGSSPR